MSDIQNKQHTSEDDFDCDCNCCFEDPNTPTDPDDLALQKALEQCEELEEKRLEEVEKRLEEMCYSERMLEEETILEEECSDEEIPSRFGFFRKIKVLERKVKALERNIDPPPRILTTSKN